MTGASQQDSSLFPRFSDQEYERRFQKVRQLMKQDGVEALIVHGNANSTGSIHYLSNYIARAPTWLIFPEGGESSLFLHFHNMIPCTQALSLVKQMQCYWLSAPDTVANDLRKRGLANASLGVIGLGASIPYAQFMALKQQLPEAKFKDLSRAYNEIRWVRSEEELGWFRKSAYLTDLACEALEHRIRPGLSEYDLSAIVHDAFLHDGGQMGIHFIATTSMSAPDRFVPWQFLTPRTLRRGDVVITELTVTYWGYGAQIHRPFAVGEAPSVLYQKLFDTAYECFERVRKVLIPGSTSEEIIEATSVIEEKGFTVYDSVVHGEGGRNPELGTRSSPHVRESWTFRENTVAIIQPNPITLDHRAGLQLGAAVVVKPSGAEVLHNYPFKFPVCGLE